MPEHDKPDSYSEWLAEIVAAQRRFVQLLAKAVVERLASESEIRQSNTGQPRERV